jgi:hypothetical protein
LYASGLAKITVSVHKHIPGIQGLDNVWSNSIYEKFRKVPGVSIIEEIYIIVNLKN